MHHFSFCSTGRASVYHCISNTVTYLVVDVLVGRHKVGQTLMVVAQQGLQSSNIPWQELLSRGYSYY